jgi:methionyl-tRNA formyltransferase
MLKITTAEVAEPLGSLAPAGTVLSLSGGKVTVACGIGSLALLAVLPEGKGRMPASAWINGRKVQVGDVLGA